MDLVAGLIHTFGTPYTCAHLLMFEKHTPLTFILWFFILVRYIGEPLVHLHHVLAFCGTSWASWAGESLVTLGDYHHLAGPVIGRIIERLWWLLSASIEAIVRGSCAHLRGRSWRETLVESWQVGVHLLSASCSTQVVGLTCEAN